MTPASNVATGLKFHKLIVVSLLGLVAASYLGAYFFLLFLKLTPTEASPLTLPRYAYYYWDKPQVRSRLIGAGALALLIVCGMALIVALPKRQSLHGDARWAKARHIRRAGLLADQGIILGRYKNRYLMLPGQTGVILAAPPRSGKGVSCVVPNLLNWPGSVLVLDIKKENWTLTAGYRSLFSEVYLFDPFSADGRTSRWNPFTYVSDNPHLRIDDVQRIATMLCQEAPGADPFWVKSARSLFVGIALYLFERRDYERAYNNDPGHKIRCRWCRSPSAKCCAKRWPRMRKVSRSIGSASSKGGRRSVSRCLPNVSRSSWMSSIWRPRLHRVSVRLSPVNWTCG